MEEEKKYHIGAFAKRFKQKGWQFVAAESKMLQWKEMEEVMEASKMWHAPDMFYGKNRLFIVSLSNRLVLSFDPFDCLSLCKDSEKEKRLAQKMEGDDLQQVNSIDLIPQKIEAAGSETFQLKDTSKIKHFQQVEPDIDWAFSNPYKGTIHRLTPQFVASIRERDDFDLLEGHQLEEVPDNQIRVDFSS